MMNRHLLVGVVVCWLAVSVATVRADPPSAEAVAAVVTNLWATEQYPALETYITNLYTSSPHYIPSILAKSFYDYVFQGDINGAIAHIQAIRDDVAAHPSDYTDTFIVPLNQLAVALDDDKAMFLRMGTLSQITPSPAATRGAWGATLPPALDIMLVAPSASLP